MVAYSCHLLNNSSCASVGSWVGFFLTISQLTVPVNTSAVNNLMKIIKKNCNVFTVKLLRKPIKKHISGGK